MYIMYMFTASLGLCEIIGRYLLCKELYSHTAMQVTCTHTHRYISHSNQNICKQERLKKILVWFYVEQTLQSVL